MMNYATTADLLESVRTYCEGSLARVAADIDRSDNIPDEVYAELVERRLFAFESLADSGPILSARDRTAVAFDCLSLVAETSPAVAKAIMDQNFGQIGMMREFGNDTILAKLREIQLGHKQAAFLMTEPQSGSDLAQFTTSYEQTLDGVVISGVKDWITGAARREYFVTLAKEAGSARNFGLFLIERDAATAGRINITDRKNKLGLRGLGEYRVELDHVFVPNEHIVIAPGDRVIRKVMTHYNLKRCGQAAICSGTTHAALRTAHDYLEARFAGGVPFQNTQFAFADLFSRFVATKSLPFSAAMQTLEGDSTGVQASIAKYVCTELAVEATTTLSQLCGGNGLSDKLPLERQMRDMRMLTVAGGASQVLQATIARNMGQLLHARAL